MLQVFVSVLWPPDNAVIMSGRADCPRRPPCRAAAAAAADVPLTPRTTPRSHGPASVSSRPAAPPEAPHTALLTRHGPAPPAAGRQLTVCHALSLSPLSVSRVCAAAAAASAVAASLPQQLPRRSLPLYLSHTRALTPGLRARRAGPLGTNTGLYSVDRAGASRCTHASLPPASPRLSQPLGAAAVGCSR